MVRILGFTRNSLGLAALSVLACLTLGTAPAKAAVYCKAVGVPKGCVVRPASGVVVARVARPPAARAAAVAPSRSVGARPGRPANRGGPVNRVGRR
jgi:hypothetical protein